ncbi:MULTISPECIES: hypothetical protein [Gammaproteobacteria]|uniref:hypothetical protein n=1 Tax=Gammaproteobacteria TaxID=1236 RepID=UPI000DCFF498|nr:MULTISPECIES: hypothetical protein [Gammaproteobacteria]RTE86414.1 hypothetical protein DQX04_07585 [Aliidiomarina sp. B3213]TCZ81692.1 hypothetical protein EYQ95_23995 [Lysobacter sp. N42]
MKFLKSLIFVSLVISTFILSSPAEANPTRSVLSAEQLECQLNCTEIVRVGHQYLVVALNHRGEIFFVEPVDIPRNARKIEDSAYGQTDHLMTASSGAGTVDVSTETYVTSTEIVVVTTIIFYNADGEIIDVQVSTHRTSLDDRIEE